MNSNNRPDFVGVATGRGVARPLVAQPPRGSCRFSCRRGRLAATALPAALLALAVPPPLPAAQPAMCTCEQVGNDRFRPFA